MVPPRVWITEEKKNKAGYGKNKMKEFTDAYNRISDFVKVEVITCPNLKKRAEIVKRFILIAEALFDIRNFHTGYSILCGLLYHDVLRMKRTWKIISSSVMETFNRLQKIMDLSGNYRNYRNLLVDTPYPCMPYAGVFTKDIFFVHEGNKTKLDGEKYNFFKFQMLTSILKKIRLAQTFKYSFHRVPLIQRTLPKLGKHSFTPKDLHRISLE